MSVKEQGGLEEKASAIDKEGIDVLTSVDTVQHDDFSTAEQAFDSSTVIASSIDTTDTHTVFSKLMSSSGRSSAKKPWEDINLGLIENPPRQTGKFYNSIMPDFYKAYWPYCSPNYHLRLHSCWKENVKWKRLASWKISKGNCLL